MYRLLPIFAALLGVYASESPSTSPAPDSPPQMIVFNGGIQSHEGCVSNETIANFTMCVVQCAKVESCQFCYMNNGCFMCKQGVLSSDTDEWRIGVKNVNKSHDKSCPAEALFLKYQEPTETTKKVTTERVTTVKAKKGTTTTQTTPTAKTTTTPSEDSCDSPYQVFWNPLKCIIPKFSKNN